MSDTSLQTPYFYPMKNVIQTYPWGSETAFTDIFNIKNPLKQPQAEVWMGAHINGCSQVLHKGNFIDLSALINQDKNAYLSQSIQESFGELPYLFKILSADKALSIQVHPSKSEAEQGFNRENTLNIPLSAAYRNYKDPNHKPELVYALTPYQAMNGFRSIPDILNNFLNVDSVELRPIVNQLQQQQDELGLRSFFIQLLSLTDKPKCFAIQDLLSYARINSGDTLCDLIVQLSEQYSNDIGLFSPLMLNVITLNPGEAMFLEARTPHAYIKGTGLEVMANSDNVLRAGLTNKHIDLTELANCTEFKTKPFDQLRIQAQQQNGILTYDIPVPDFKFTLYQCPKNQMIANHSADILLSLTHSMKLTHSSGDTITIQKGKSIFIPAYTGSYTLHSIGNVARVHN